MPLPPLTIKIAGIGSIHSRMRKYLQVTENKVKLYDRIGIFVIAWVNRNFRAQGLEHPWKALRPSTLFSKHMAGKGAKALSGLQAFATHKASSRNVIVGFPDESPAKYHHYGTPGPYIIEPRNKLTLRFISLPIAGRTVTAKRKAGAPKIGMVKGDNQSFMFAKKVTHPGLPPRPLLPSQRLGAELARMVIEEMFKETSGG